MLYLARLFVCLLGLVFNFCAATAAAAAAAILFPVSLFENMSCVVSVSVSVVGCLLLH